MLKWRNEFADFRLPGHEPEDVEIGVNSKEDNEEDEEERQRFQDPNQELGNSR
jgi:hypothetical protein